MLILVARASVTPLSNMSIKSKPKAYTGVSKSIVVVASTSLKIGSADVPGEICKPEPVSPEIWSLAVVTLRPEGDWSDTNDTVPLEKVGPVKSRSSS